MSIASLPMYDLPEVRSATDTFWQAIAAELEARGVRDVPRSLDRARDHETQWADPRLIFGQSCGYPITHRFERELRVVATPVYVAAGCHAARYSSVIVVRETDPAIPDASALRGRVVAVNDLASYSGASALAAVVAPHADGASFFSKVMISGSHPESLAMLTRGEADVAAIDCVTHALLTTWRPESLANTRVLAYSPEAPALPYVTRREASDAVVATLRSALEAVMQSAEPTVVAARATLLLSGVELVDEAVYRAYVAGDQVNRSKCGLTDPACGAIETRS